MSESMLPTLPEIPPRLVFFFFFSPIQMREYGQACILHERERCVKIIEQDLYPNIRVLAEKIRSGA